MNKLYIKLLGVLFLSLSLASCQIVSMVTGVYSAATTYKTVKETKRLTNAMKNAKPVFIGYDSIVVEANLMPRESGKAEEIARAFKDNLGYLVEQNAHIGSSKIKVCKSSQCQGKVLIVRFNEEGYNKDLLEKITLGAKLKGTVTFIDKRQGKVLEEVPQVASENYADILKQLHAVIGSSVIKSELEKTPKKDQDKYRARLNELNEAYGKIQPIKPEYADLFEAS